MKNGKPRGRTPSLIGGANGRPTKAVVKRKCECARCHTELVKDMICFDVPKLGSSFSNKKRFCEDCFQKVLIQTSTDLEELKNL